MGYDFSQLNDKEFEILSTDLLSVLFGERIERFKPGKDSGVDGRYFSIDKKEIVIQCKHYLKSGFKTLIRVARKEVEKVSRLHPKKYLFVTSLTLSRENKTEIKEIFSPYIENENDVFGQEDLNDILSKHPEIEEKHYKLWIASTTVLNRIINNAIVGRSKSEIGRISANAHKYVITSNHNKAIRTLNENNVLIISGEPGIGKTTLAENICLNYIAKQYMFIDIEENLSEAEQVYKPGEKQIFYLDDFLGSNYFEAIENKKDSHILKFIDRVKSDNSKKFILTSRTNILNSGIVHSSIFENKKIRINEFLLVVQDLTKIEKAKILYNHIWFSNLSNEFIDEIYKNKRYHKIINHKNFNPRLIEFITDTDRVDVSENDYWEFVLKTLDNPKAIWANSFKVQSNVFTRNLVMLTVFNGGQILEVDLRYSFNTLNEIEDIKNTSHTEKDFNSSALLAVKSFLNRNKTQWNCNYTLFNPSIGDFILNEYCEDIPKIKNIYKSLNTIESLKALNSLVKEGVISKIHGAQILEDLFDYSFENNKPINYLVYISYLLMDNALKKDRILDFLNQIILSPTSITEYSKFIDLLNNFWGELDIEDLIFLPATFENYSLGYRDLVSLMSFLDHYYDIDKYILIAIVQQIENYLISELDQIIYDNVDLSKHVNTVYDDDGDNYEETIELDSVSFINEVENNLKKMVEEILGGNSCVGEQLDLDYDNIINPVDEDKLLDEYRGFLNADLDQPHDYDSADINDDIDDLFERS